MLSGLVEVMATFRGTFLQLFESLRSYSMCSGSCSKLELSFDKSFKSIILCFLLKCSKLSAK